MGKDEETGELIKIFVKSINNGEETKVCAECSVLDVCF